MGISSRQEIKPEAQVQPSCYHIELEHRTSQRHKHQSKSPIEYIPAELLSEIFLHCGPTISYHPQQLNLPLTQVCHQWRTAACSTLEIWANLRIVWDDPSIETREGAALHLCHSWLRRAGSYPLQISIHGKDVLRFMNPVRDIVLPNSHRIRSLELDYEPRISRSPGYGHYPCGYSGLEVLPGKSLPSLVFASFTFTDRQAPIFSSRSIAIQSAPNLRCLELRNSSYRLDYRMLPAPWSQITHLTLDDPFSNPNDATAVLLQCTNLIRCSLTMLIWTDERVFPGEEVVMSYLEELTLHICGHRGRSTTSGDMSPLYNRITLPALKYLKIWHTNVAEISIDALFGLLSRSSAPLETMVLENISFMPEQFGSLLHHTPELKQFNMIGFHNMDTILWDIYWRLLKKRRQNVLPKLESMVIDITTHPYDDEDIYLDKTDLGYKIPRSLLDFVDDRRRLSRLSKLVFIIGMKVDELVPGVQNKVASWKEMGLNVVIC
ncbi:hypothetical protein BDQ17DRAFT_672371 [Cyathus striatus]|nr:hypothetical protein BDQ17DRAFT_672371 [Cyathus striatus]